MSDDKPTPPRYIFFHLSSHRHRRVASAWLMIAVDCRRVGVASESERAISTTPSAVPVPYAGELTTRLLGVGAIKFNRSDIAPTYLRRFIII